MRWPDPNQNLREKAACRLESEKITGKSVLPVNGGIRGHKSPDFGGVVGGGVGWGGASLLTG